MAAGFWFVGGLLLLAVGYLIEVFAAAGLVSLIVALLVAAAPLRPVSALSIGLAILYSGLAVVLVVIEPNVLSGAAASGLCGRCLLLDRGSPLQARPCRPGARGSFVVTWRREVRRNPVPSGLRWFLVNDALLNVYVFVLSAVQGVIHLVSSSDGTIPGWSGSPIEQVVSFAATGVLFLSLVSGIPVLVVALAAWVLTIRIVGHPRLTAYLVASVIVVGAAVLIERTEPFYLAIVLAMAFGYATIVREPNRALVSARW
jgi:hypothetical protein